MSTVTAVVPAHNEQDTIGDALRGLLAQTRPPDRVVVVCDNCDDETEARAREVAHASVVVTRTVGNRAKKAGALNQVLDVLLAAQQGPDDVLVVQDADSLLAPTFIESGLRHLEADPRLGACGGTFRAAPAVAGARRGLWLFQDNEFARYARDVRRRKGRCLVVTGTGAAFRASTLRHIAAERGRALPSGDGQGGVYDTEVLTEDNELSFAAMHLGYRLLAPSDMTLLTEAMPTLSALGSQRARWKRGAIENCVQYGLTRITAPYWGRQVMSFVGIVATALYLLSIVLTLALVGDIRLHPFWLGVTAVFMIERAVSLRDKGPRAMLAAFTMYELPYDLFLQGVHAKALADAIRKKKKEW